MILSLGLFAQSHNDYMEGDAVSGATDYIFQWIIIIVGVVIALYILAHLLNATSKIKNWYNGSTPTCQHSKEEEYLSRATFNVEICIKCKKKRFSVYGYQMDGWKIVSTNDFMGYIGLAQSEEFKVLVNGKPTRSFHSRIFSEKDLLQIESISKDWKHLEISAIRDDFAEYIYEEMYLFNFEIKGLFDSGKLEIGAYLGKNDFGVHGINSNSYYIPEVLYYNGKPQYPIEQ